MSEELDRLAELEAKATPGPWRVSLPVAVSHSAPMRWLRAPRSDDADAVSIGSQRLPADADFVAALRNAAPALLAAARDRDELRAWQREAVPYLIDARDALLDVIALSDEFIDGHLRDLLARVKP